MSQAADEPVGPRLVTDAADVAADVTGDDLGGRRSPPGVVELTDDELGRVVGGSRAAV